MVPDQDKLTYPPTLSGLTTISIRLTVVHDPDHYPLVETLPPRPAKIPVHVDFTVKLIGATDHQALCTMENLIASVVQSAPASLHAYVASEMAGFSSYIHRPTPSPASAPVFSATSGAPLDRTIEESTILESLTGPSPCSSMNPQR